MNTQYSHNGFFIAAELDLDGEPTGAYLVISNGKVVHIAASFNEAKKWIVENTLKPTAKPYSSPRPGF